MMNEDFDDDFYFKDTKASRKERKRASFKDQSKYKKSDQDQIKKQPVISKADHLPLGRVLSIVPEGAIVCSDGAQLVCTLKGSLKHDRSQLKNLLAVGDFVRIDNQTIIHIEPRQSILSRADNLSRNKQQLIAVNIDQVLITASVISPKLKPFLIDRYIIATEKGHMQPIILINKIDYLLAPSSGVDLETYESEKALFEECLKIYRGLHIPVIPISVEKGIGIDALKSVMRGKTSVFSGQSGVGKSSLINLVTGSTLATGAVVEKTSKGSHTTTSAHLVPLEEGGFCIDTPGIKSFGLWDLHESAISSYFPEIFSLSSECKYPDCSHRSEPGCAVKKAVEENRISSLRFASYCALMSSVSQEHQHR